MANLSPPPVEEEKEDWLVTYADAITLLMAFFVMLLTFAEYDIPAFQEAAEAIKANIGQKEKTDSPIQLLKIDVEDVVYNMQADQVVKVSQDDKGIVIELSSTAFYKPGSAEMREQALPVLDRMADVIKAPRYLTYIIEVEGHTDDDPIHTARFPSNWELSAARATTVIRFFIERGMDAERMKAVGLAETRPKVPNRDPEGQPIKENQSINRRVAIRVYPMSLDERQEFLVKIEIKRLLQKVQGDNQGGGTAPGAVPQAQPPAAGQPVAPPDLSTSGNTAPLPGAVSQQ